MSLKSEAFFLVPLEYSVSPRKAVFRRKPRQAPFDHEGNCFRFHARVWQIACAVELSAIVDDNRGNNAVDGGAISRFAESLGFLSNRRPGPNKGAFFLEP